jgi:hypothetical protein
VDRKHTAGRCDPSPSTRSQLEGCGSSEETTVAAIQGTRFASPVAGVFVVGVSAALLVGATSGYLVRALTSQVSAPAQAVQRQPARVEAQAPTWVQNYTTPGESSRFSVDQFIEGLSYAPTVEADDLPAWVQAAYTTRTDSLQFKVDQLIESLSYTSTVKTENFPEWLQKYIAPAETPAFRVDEYIASLS